MRIVLPGAGLWRLLAVAFMASQPAGGQTAADEASLRARIAAHEQASAKNDLRGLVDVYSRDAQMSSGNGTIIQGRDGIEAYYQRQIASASARSGRHHTHPSELIQIRFVMPDVALIDLPSRSVGGQDAAGQPMAPSDLTLIAVWRKVAGEWLVVSQRALPASPPPATAQSPAEVQVRAVVDSFFAAGAAERWPAAAKLLDMDAFDRILKQAQGSARADLPRPPMTVESLMAQDSTMPRAVAEWQLARFSQFGVQDPYPFLTYEFARVTTPRELLALTRDDAAARWLEAQDVRYQMRLSWKRAGCPGDMPSGTMMPERHAVLGVAIGNDSTAYVIHAVTMGMMGLDVSSADMPLSVMVLTRRGPTWRINPSSMQHQGGIGLLGPVCGK